MPNKNYLRGYSKEREVVNEFRKKGFVAYRSAGSHSIIDVTIHFPEYVLVLQLKRVKKKGYNFDKDLETLRKMKTPAHKELWVYRDYEKRGNKWQKIIL